MLHAVLLQSFPGSFLTLVPWWATAIVVALLTAWLSFAFYAVGVLISMGAVGWGLGQFVSTLLHAPGWISFALGLVVAAGLVMVGWALDLPKALLIVLTAFIGAGSVVDGVQLLLGARFDWASQIGWQLDLTGHAVWAGAFVVLAGLGMVIQFRQHSDDTLRQAYQHR